MASKYKIIRGDPFSFVAHLTKNDTDDQDLTGWAREVKLRKGSVQGAIVTGIVQDSLLGEDLFIEFTDTTLLVPGIYILQIKLIQSVPSVTLRESISILVTDIE